MSTRTLFIRRILACALLIPLVALKTHAADVNGTMTKWHKLTLSFNGPSTHELALPNPFTDYRLDVLFSGPSGQEYQVPGFYAADGNAAETSADSGDIWQVNFCPDETGNWEYQASFVSGENIAAELTGGSSAGFFDGETGTFTILENESPDPKDYRNKGKLIYTGEHYLRFSETGEYFLKAGANSPEVFLEYADFDNTPSTRKYASHEADWMDGDPTWQDGKGKGIIGVVNYLSSVGINAYYFLTMNAYGDGKKAWPWVHQDSIVRYDCSKLEQWDIVFGHMNTRGLMVHLVLTETENESYFEVEELGEPGGFADSRKIYYREMVARYAYLPAITWNMGEENGWHSNAQYQQANSDQQRMEACDRLRELSYYEDHISIHNGPSWDDHIFEPLLGHTSHTGPAFQWDNSNKVYQKILEWRSKSADAGHPWVVSFDEPYVNPEFINATKWRRDNVWPTFMAGGAGIELYVGSGLDLRIEDFRRYEEYFRIMTIASEYLSSELPFDQMIPDDQVSEHAYVLNLKDSLYLLFFPDASDKTVSLPEGSYQVRWFDPRQGGETMEGQIRGISGGEEVPLGMAPDNPTLDWLCVLSRTEDFTDTLELVEAPGERIFEEGRADMSKKDSMALSVSGATGADIGLWISDTALISVDWSMQVDSVHSYLLSLKDSVNTLPPGAYAFSVAFNMDEAATLLVPYRIQVQEAPSTVSVPRLRALPLSLKTNVCLNELEILGSCEGPVEAMIYNLNGMLISRQHFEEITGARMGMGHLQKGMYLLRLESSKGIATHRFIKI